MRRWVGAAVLAAVSIMGVPWAWGQPAAKPGEAPAKDTKPLRGLSLKNEEFTGDFDGMLERRMIRVFVPYSRSLYFNDRGRERGLTADTVRDFERWINRKYETKTGRRPITVYILPETRENLLPDLARGLGDIAAGNLTVTEARLRQADFVAPEGQRPVSELLVTGPGSPAVNALDDLAGKSVYARKASSYHESLLALNVRFKEAGQPPARIVTVPDALEDEDLLEMLNAGQLEALVVDDWKARMWAQVLPRIKVHENVKLREGGRIGWAVRKDSPRLSAELREFYADHIRKQNVHEARLAQYMRRVKRIKNSTAGSDWKRFEQTLALFEKYGEQYGFDPLMLAAQGYQESALDQRARSHVGAVGIMQIMPATGAELRVGDIRIAEANVHAGAKYMDRLMAKYFKDAGFTGVNRTLFAFASYNCGPGNVAKMRKAAAARGLDPDRWFNNVEIVTAEKIGIETTTYVRNIYKYYAAYRLALDAIGEQRQARERMQKGL